MGLIDYILDSILDEDFKGRRGEKLTERELKWLKLFGRGGKILKNIYVPKDTGGTTEIDVLFITVKGLFVIESKNYSGWIFGDEKSYKWTAMLPNKQKNQFYNPVKQNQTHIKWLFRLVDENIPVYSIIAFSERCELKKIPQNTDTLRVVKRDRLYAAIRDIWDKHENVIDEAKVNEIYEKLKPFTNADKAVKEAHIEDIKARYDQNIKADSCTSGENDMICPKCGGRLVLRTAGKGAYAGKQFYGCSNYPKCRYIRNID